jgi:diguanylate cyclase (GGDEF)-like protein
MSEVQIDRTGPSTFLSQLVKVLEANTVREKATGLLVVHLANFDRLVSAFGYRMGDRIVAAFAEHLREVVRSDDVVVRISDSKFAVVVNPLRNDGILILAANKIGKIFAQPVPAGPAKLMVDIRIGMSASPQDGADAEGLLQHAETALLSAIAEDRPTVRYSEEQAARNLASLNLEVELEQAIKRKDFQLHYQPKISTKNFKPCGAEALIRWTSPTRGPVSPELFIPIADREGRIEPLTAFVLNTSLRQAAEWPTTWGKLPVSINLTPRLLLDSDLVGMVAGALKLWDFEPSRLMLEVTEGAAMTDPQRSFAIMSELRALGVQISIDDFGTGYSSLAHFKNIPADEVKIDKSFVLNMLDNEGDLHIIKSVVDLSRGFGLKVTAEGVENEQSAALLAKMCCDQLQGYYYSRPLPQQQFVAWLNEFDVREAVAV